MKVIWRCAKCNSMVISDSNKRHTMDWCYCGSVGVDLENDYMRVNGLNYRRVDIIGDSKE